MINSVILTGRLVELPKMCETETKRATIVLEVVRSYKNDYGIYDVDKIPVTLLRGYAEIANDVCQIGDMLGIKGRIQTYSVEKESQTYYNYEIIAEHVSFMGS